MERAGEAARRGLRPFQRTVAEFARIPPSPVRNSGEFRYTVATNRLAATRRILGQSTRRTEAKSSQTRWSAACIIGIGVAPESFVLSSAVSRHAGHWRSAPAALNGRSNRSAADRFASAQPFVSHPRRSQRDELFFPKGRDANGLGKFVSRWGGTPLRPERRTWPSARKAILPFWQLA
jgi:hypothetical protein